MSVSVVAGPGFEPTPQLPIACCVARIRPLPGALECKGRKGTVEPDTVRSAANNALAEKDLARIVIATNTQFSNATRDWVKTWQAKHPEPRVVLWDHIALERMLSEHPQVVLRLFSHTLSPAGRARDGGALLDQD
jgi:hypothetical protein